MKHFLIVNGLDHAFRSEFGCPCQRCARRETTANTSVSLITSGESPGEVIHHVLFDVGSGVVDSLSNSPCLSGDSAQLDQLVLSHWHPDHVLGLNRLCETWQRTLERRGAQWKPIPTWCRSGTADWLKKSHPYELGRFIDLQASHEFYPPGSILRPITLDCTGASALTISPVAVSHSTADINAGGEPTPCSASFVIKRKNGPKAVLLWDLDNQNHWIENPVSDQERESVGLLSNADNLFIACNTWSQEEVNGRNLGHASFQTVQGYVRALSPRGTTFLVHLSGHEDGQGNPGWGWCNRTWEDEARRLWESRRLPGEVRVPEIGSAVHL